MMAEPPPTCHRSMETAGEGNYASTGFSNSRDQMTDQGLTLHPVIQSSEWPFEAAGSLADVDLDALLGPVPFDLDPRRADARKDDAWLHALFDGDNEAPEPPPKRRKRSEETPKESIYGGNSAKPAGPDAPQPAPRLFSKLTFPSIPPPDVASGSSVEPSSQLNGCPLESSTPGNPNGPVGTLATVHNVIESSQEHAQPNRNSTEDSMPYFPEDNGHGSEMDFADGGSGSHGHEDLPIAEAGSEISHWSVPDAQSMRLISPQVHRPGSNKRSRNGRPTTTLPRYISKKAALEYGVRTGLFSLDNNRPPPSASPVPDPRVVRKNQPDPVQDRYDKQKQLLVLQTHPALLPLSIAFAITQPLHHRSALKLVVDALTSKDPTHRVPEQLRLLFDNLERKLNNDTAFRKSTFVYLSSKMASSLDGEGPDGGGVRNGSVASGNVAGGSGSSVASGSREGASSSQAQDDKPGPNDNSEEAYSGPHSIIFDYSKLLSDGRDPELDRKILEHQTEYLHSLMEDLCKDPRPTKDQMATAVAEATAAANGRIEELEAEVRDMSDAASYWHRLATNIPHVLRILELERELEKEKADGARWRQLYVRKIRETNPAYM